MGKSVGNCKEKGFLRAPKRIKSVSRFIDGLPLAKVRLEGRQLWLYELFRERVCDNDLWWLRSCGCAR